MQCCGSGMFIPDPGSDFFPSRIPDPNCLHPGSRILVKEFKYFNPQKRKNWFFSSKKYDPGCSSRIRMLTFSHPGSRIQGSKRHPIPDPGSGSATLEKWLHKGSPSYATFPTIFSHYRLPLDPDADSKSSFLNE
jgi:hypothetical protein